MKVEKVTPSFTPVNIIIETSAELKDIRDTLWIASINAIKGTPSEKFSTNLLASLNEGLL